MRLRLPTVLLATTAALSLPVSLTAAPPAPEKPSPADKSATPRSHADEMKADVERAWARPPVEELAQTSKGAVTVRGQRIAYTATAGTLTIRDDDGKPTASMFYTAYVRDGGGNRPVTFFYNGGPGSPTVWLHMGSFAPVRVATDDPVYVGPASYALRPNPDSLIDRTDMVFIDAIGAGWSRPLGDKTGKDFWGVDQDADAFARATMRYIDRNDRWNSPKVLFGESYGTLRSGAVAALLEERGMSIDGIVLLSTILNYGVRQPGYDHDTLGLLPTFAATAWYHNRLASRPPALAPFLEEVRAWASGPYAAALARGDALPPEEARAIGRQLAAYTGLSEDFVMRANLRVSLAHFQTELLRDRGLATGRLDTRYTLNVADANADSPEDDPASTAITGAYYSSFLGYARQVLGFRPDMPYKLTARDSSFDWDWKHRAPGQRYPQTTPNTAVDLAATMRTNPGMKVLFLNGYYDAATPFFATEDAVAHMGLAQPLRRNITMKYYESGHMVYLNPRELTRMHDDVAAWYDTATRR